MSERASGRGGWLFAALSRHPLPLALVLLALLLVATALERRLASRAALPARTEKLVPLHAGEEPFQVAALVVTRPDAPPFRYASSRGAWRCVSALGAPAHMGRIGELVGGLARAHGMPRPLAPTELARAGLDPSAAIRVTLLRSDGSELLALDVGAALPGPGGGRTFVRRAGEPQALEIDAAPRALLESAPGDLLPPLLDRRVLAGTPLDPRLGFRRLLLERPEGISLELIPDPAAPEEFAWILLENGIPTEAPALALRVAGYFTFLVRAPYEGLASTDRAEALGLASPTRLTLFPPEADPVVLEIGPASERSLAPIQNRTSDLILLVDPAQLELFAPSSAMLTDPDLADPWEAWLRG